MVRLLPRERVEASGETDLRGGASVRSCVPCSAILALDAGRGGPTDRLIEGLLQDRSARRRGELLATVVSKLRNALLLGDHGSDASPWVRLARAL